jgi:hypothetical protein
MRNLEKFTTELVIATGATALALPPGSYGVVPDEWYDSKTGAPAEVELELRAEEAIAVTNAVLYSARSHLYAFADIVLASVTNATNTLTKNGHGLLTGDGPLNFTSAGTYPTGLSAAVSYWWIKTGANTGKLALSRADALAGTAVDFSTDGSGVLTLVDQATTERLYWCTHDGLLGLAGDGAITLDIGVAYSKRIPHSPRVVAYALVATLSTGAVSAGLYPIKDR